MLTATVNPMLMNTGSEHIWRNVFDKIQRSCGVQCQFSVLGVMLTGSLSQVTRAGEIIEQNYQHLQFSNVDNTNLFNESDTNASTVDQHGMTNLIRPYPQSRRIPSPEKPRIPSPKKSKKGLLRPLEHY